jgi:hypothetical protein
VLFVRLDRLGTEEQFLGNGPNALAFADEAENLQLPLGQSFQQKQVGVRFGSGQPLERFGRPEERIRSTRKPTTPTPSVNPAIPSAANDPPSRLNAAARWNTTKARINPFRIGAMK